MISHPFVPVQLNCPAKGRRQINAIFVKLNICAIGFQLSYSHVFLLFWFSHPYQK
jgi:hypothetical protein